MSDVQKRIRIETLEDARKIVDRLSGCVRELAMKIVEMPKKRYRTRRSLTSLRGKENEEQTKKCVDVLVSEGVLERIKRKRSKSHAYRVNDLCALALGRLDEQTARNGSTSPMRETNRCVRSDDDDNDANDRKIQGMSFASDIPSESKGCSNTRVVQSICDASRNVGRTMDQEMNRNVANDPDDDTTHAKIFN